MRPSVSLAQTACFIAALVGCSSPPHVRPANVAPSPANAPPQWEWDLNDFDSHVLVLVVQAESGRLRQAFALAAGPPLCAGRAAPPDSTFLRRGVAFLRGVGWDAIYPRQQSVQRIGLEFISVSAFAGDPSAFVLFHETGLLVYAGTKVWSGHGTRLYPSDAIDTWDLRFTDSLAPPPTGVWKNDSFPDSLMRRLQHLNAVQAFGARPYRATIILHSKVGEFPFDDADWVVLLTRRGQCN